MELAIIGLDGLDPRLVEQWRADLPTLDTLIDDGSFGELRSSMPPLTVPAWPTMYTGKQGGKHGVFSFTRGRAESYEQVPVNFTDVRAESLWEALDAAGLACGVVNVPLTYPPSDLEEGFVISGWPVPNNATIASDPSVVSKLERELSEPYRVNPFPLTIEFDQFDNDRLYEEIRDGLTHHRRAYTHLLDTHGDGLDVFFCVFMAVDIASHNFAFDRSSLKRLYAEQDAALGAILERLPDECNVVVMSDHGHAVKGEWSFHVNEWLARNGFLSLSSETDSTSLLGSAGVTLHNLVRLKNWLGLERVHERLPQRVRDWIVDTVPRSDESTHSFRPELIAWDETTAYSAQQNLLSLNTADNPAGTVSADEYEQTRTELIDALEGITHPDGDRSLISQIQTREELFEGPFAEQAPDIVFIADEMRCNAPMGFADSVFTAEQWGEHRQHGTLITSGPAFTTQSDSADRTALPDVMPLVLALCDVAIPENVDGSLPRDRLAVELDATFRESRDERTAATRYSETESDDIKEQLDALGYLE